MRDLFNALKTLERYGLLPEKKGQRITREQIQAELNGGGKRLRKPVTDAEIALAVKMRNANKPWKEIEAATGRNASVLARHLD